MKPVLLKQISEQLNISVTNCFPEALKGLIPDISKKNQSFGQEMPYP